MKFVNLVNVGVMVDGALKIERIPLKLGESVIEPAVPTTTIRKLDSNSIGDISVENTAWSIQVPPPEDGVIYIVNPFVLFYLRGSRFDCVACSRKVNSDGTQEIEKLMRYTFE